jgi:hypothetical protein
MAAAVATGRGSDHATIAQLGEPLGVVLGDPGPAIQPPRQAREAAALEGGEDLVEAAVVAEAMVQKPIRPVLPVVAQHPHPAGEIRVVGDDGAPFAGRPEGVHLDEREDAGVAPKPGRAPVENGALRDG